MAHTPVPWTNDDGLVTGGESRTRFAPGVSVDIFDASEWGAEQHDEAMANAALIAAAPEMLIALKAGREIIADHIADMLCSYCIIGADGLPLRDTLDPDEEDSVAEEEGALALIDAAIAKAESV